MALKLAEEQAQKEEDERKEEEANNPMKVNNALAISRAYMLVLGVQTFLQRPGYIL